MALHYVTAEMVTDMKVTDTPISGRYSTGYGPKIPTAYMLRVDNRWRRVYVVCYGNSGSAYIVYKGQDFYLDIDVEHALRKVGED